MDRKEQELRAAGLRLGQPGTGRIHPPGPETEIGAVVERLESYLSGVEEQVSVLLQRLSPVLSAAVPVPATPKDVQAPVSELGLRLFSSAGRAEALLNLLIETRDRLCL